MLMASIGWDAYNISAPDALNFAMQLQAGQIQLSASASARVEARVLRRGTRQRSLFSYACGRKEAGERNTTMHAVPVYTKRLHQQVHPITMLQVWAM